MLNHRVFLVLNIYNLAKGVSVSAAAIASFSVMNFSMKVLGHDFVSEQCKWNCPPMVWNAPSWPLKGDNWKIQDEATVKVGTLC